MVRNPNLRTELAIVQYNYEHLDEKKGNFVNVMREIQQQQWSEEGQEQLEAAQSGDVAVVSLFSTKPRYYMLVQLTHLQPVPHGQLGAHAPTLDHTSPFSPFVSADDSWVLGVEVEPTSASAPLDLARTSRVRAVPVKSLRSLLRASSIRSSHVVAEPEPQITAPTLQTADVAPTSPTGPPNAWKLQRAEPGAFAASARLFTMSYSVFLAARPFQIRKGTRETCLCQYHLRWDFMCEGLRRLLQRRRRASQESHASGAGGGAGGGNSDDEGSGGGEGGGEGGGADEASDEEEDADGLEGGGGSGAEGPLNSTDLLRALSQPSKTRDLFVCPQEGGYYKPACLENRCLKCRNFQLFHQRLAGTDLLPNGALTTATADADLAMEGEEDEEDEDLEVAAEGGGGRESGQGMAGGDDGGVGGDGERREVGEVGDVGVAGGGDGGAAARSNSITYDRWQSVEYVMKDGRIKRKHDFVTVTVSLREFWDDVQKFWYPFIRHHDLAKWCDHEWGNLKVNFKPQQVVLVMDASEAHAHLLRREHQSAYFAQVTTTLWVVVLRFHLEDLANIDDAEKERLRAAFEAADKPAIIRETHYYMTADKEKDQAQVQHILTDIANYLSAKGRWAAVDTCCSCGVSLNTMGGEGEDGGDGDGGEGEGSNTCPTCGGVARYFEQEGLTEAERQERGYYEGQAAGVDSTSFSWIKAFSDGCAAQFMCATFLLFISRFVVMFGIACVWHWFCSCHVSRSFMYARTYARAHARTYARACVCTHDRYNHAPNLHFGCIGQVRLRPRGRCDQALGRQLREHRLARRRSTTRHTQQCCSR